MITRNQANKLAYIKAMDENKTSSYVKNLIIRASMAGNTAIKFDKVFTTDKELDELRELGYTVEEHYPNGMGGKKELSTEIRVYWNHE